MYRDENFLPYTANEERFLPFVLLAATAPAFYGRPGFGYGRPWYGYGRPGFGFGRPWYGFGRPGFGFGRPWYGYGRPWY